jgi:hypothetical protein
MDKGRVSTKLDWNRMLGFEQIAEERDSIREVGQTLSPKVGDKTGPKVGIKLGQKIGNKEGVKVKG